MVGTELLQAGTVTLNPLTGQAALEGNPMELTRKEFLLLRCLLERKNQVVSRNELLYLVWGGRF